jgi:hypothetical protein
MKRVLITPRFQGLMVYLPASDAWPSKLLTNFENVPRKSPTHHHFRASKGYVGCDYNLLQTLL